jgi:YlmC/YmxH family sporulation protein
VICSLDNIRSKEVIDIQTGERLGYIDDVEMNLSTAGINAFIIYGSKRFFGILGRDENIMIPCDSIEVIGNDVLLIKRTEEYKSAKCTNTKRNSTESLFK